MMNVKATFELRFYGTLPDDAQSADDAFDAMGDRIIEILNRADLEEVGIVNESFSIVTGDTEEDA
jgi:hypothetical protein